MQYPHFAIVLIVLTSLKVVTGVLAIVVNCTTSQHVCTDFASTIILKIVFCKRNSLNVCTEENCKLLLCFIFILRLIAKSL